MEAVNHSPRDQWGPAVSIVASGVNATRGVVTPCESHPVVDLAAPGERGRVKDP